MVKQEWAKEIALLDEFRVCWLLNRNEFECKYHSVGLKVSKIKRILPGDFLLSINFRHLPDKNNSQISVMKLWLNSQEGLVCMLSRLGLYVTIQGL